MKTPEQILDEKFTGEIKLRIAGPTVWQRGLILSAMKEYAQQEGKRVEEFWENAHANTECKLKDKINELQRLLMESKSHVIPSYCELRERIDKAIAL